MKMFLMNKNTKVLKCEYNKQFKTFTEIYEIYNIDYAPLSVSNASKLKSKSVLTSLNEWFKGRGIPSWRQDLKRLLENIGIESPEELLDKAFALSLSDQYWIKDENDIIEWKNINFFHNDFEFQGFLEASLSGSSHRRNVSLKSPNNTTDGMVKKAWIIDDKKRVLVKGSYNNFQQEPINEWLTSQICKRLGFDYCDYTIGIENDKLVSKCENFISDNEEILTAYDIFSTEKKSNNTNDFTHYLNILEKHNVPNAREALENMMVVDYLVMNFDRHMRNYGVIRNVETLKWEKITPIFDTGESMQCDKNTIGLNFYAATGKYFSNTNKKFNSFLDDVSNLDRFNISSLDGLPEEYRKIQEKYQSITDISEERIDKLVKGLERRIKLFKEKQQALNKETIDELEEDIDI